MAVREQNVGETKAEQAGSSTPLVQRHFTDGVHPFEKVQWETRDAVIGSVFEQRGIEFPASWSQNSRGQSVSCAPSPMISSIGGSAGSPRVS